MLKFETWPPEAGKISFSKGAQIDKKNLEELREIGQFTGSLLYANMGHRYQRVWTAVNRLLTSAEMPLHRQGYFSEGVESGIIEEVSALSNARVKSGAHHV